MTDNIFTSRELITLHDGSTIKITDEPGSLGYYQFQYSSKYRFFNLYPIEDNDLRSFAWEICAIGGTPVMENHQGEEVALQTLPTGKYLFYDFHVAKASMAAKVTDEDIYKISELINTVLKSNDK